MSERIIKQKLALSVVAAWRNIQDYLWSKSDTKIEGDIIRDTTVRRRHSATHSLTYVIYSTTVYV